MGITVIVGTFGSSDWENMGRETAESLREQTLFPDKALHSHGSSLQYARNSPAFAASSDWLLFLDADDSLDKRFIEEMTKKSETVDRMTLIRPAITTHQKPKPHVLPVKNIFKANFMIIGTLVSKELFDLVGGFRNLPMYEDWDLWVRCTKVGAKYDSCPKAIYHINHNDRGRNFGQNLAIAQRTIRKIVGPQ